MQYKTPIESIRPWKTISSCLFDHKSIGHIHDETNDGGKSYLDLVHLTHYQTTKF